jgi:hypothetical protein
MPNVLRFVKWLTQKPQLTSLSTCRQTGDRSEAIFWLFRNSLLKPQAYARSGTIEPFETVSLFSQKRLPF